MILVSRPGSGVPLVLGHPVFRGNGWSQFLPEDRVAYRYALRPQGFDDYLGFRIVLRKRIDLTFPNSGQ